MNEWENTPVEQVKNDNGEVQTITTPDMAENSVAPLQADEKQAKPVNKKPYKRTKLSDVLFYVLLAAAFVGIYNFRVWWVGHYGGVSVVGNSMQQTLQNGDELFVQFHKDGAKAKRGDIIVVYVGDYQECASMREQYIIKRLIAVEGDKVRCTDGQVEICYAGTQDFVLLQEEYAYYGSYQASYDFAEYTVGENEIFFLGDNRSHDGSSIDSRYQEGKSHLTHLYQEKDIYGIVPSWALELRWLSQLFI